MAPDRCRRSRPGFRLTGVTLGCCKVRDQPRNPPKYTQKRNRINFPFRVRVLPGGQLPPVGWCRSVLLATVGVGRGYYLGEPSGAAVTAARRAGSPRPEQMDRKMLRFVEKTRNSHRQNAPSADKKYCQHLDLRFHNLNKCTVNCLDKSEHRGVQTDKTPPARTEVLSARGEESKPVAHPCRGPGGQAGDHQKRQGRALPESCTLPCH